MYEMIESYIHRQDSEQHLRRGRQDVRDVNQEPRKVGGIGVALVEERQRAGAVRCPDVEELAPRSVLVVEACGLENLAGDLVDGRVAVSTERGVRRRLADDLGIPRDGLRVVKAVRALVPLRAAVRIVGARDQTQV